MSLSSFLAISDVRQNFRDSISIQTLPKVAAIKAQPLTKNYSLMGTAFDYLLRFYLCRLNPKVRSQTWVSMTAAEFGILLCKDQGDEKTAKRIAHLMDYSTSNVIKYLKTGKVTDSLLKSTIYLAQLDIIYRAGIIDPNLGKINRKDLADLRYLLTIVPLNIFKTKKICVLNPTFGIGSQLVGGADADIVLDNSLIDIKTTKEPKFSNKMLYQVIGYYLLSMIGHINNTPKTHKINRLGIYFSRSGQLVTIPVSDIKFRGGLKQFVGWFKTRAKKEFKP